MQITPFIGMWYLKWSDRHTMRKEWDALPQPGRRIASYPTYWWHYSSWYGVVSPSPIASYTFKNLKPGGTIIAHVSAYIQSGGSGEHSTLHILSCDAKETIPGSRGTKSFHSFCQRQTIISRRLACIETVNSDAQLRLLKYLCWHILSRSAVKFTWTVDYTHPV